MKDLSLEKLTITEIILLEGRELDVAVCLALGYKWFRRDGNKLYLCPPDKIYMYTHEVRYPSEKDIEEYTLTSQYEVPPYSSDIGLAMQLDENGWEWVVQDRIFIYDNVINVELFAGRYNVTGYARWKTLSEKPSAYANARCKAYLQAKKKQLVNSGI